MSENHLTSYYLLYFIKHIKKKKKGILEVSVHVTETF